MYSHYHLIPCTSNIIACYTVWSNQLLTFYLVMDRFSIQRNTSLKDYLATFDYIPIVTDNEEEDCVLSDVLTILSNVRPLLFEDILKERVRLQNIKWHIACRIRFKKTVVDGDSGDEKELTNIAVFHGRCHTLLTDDTDELNQLLNASYDKIFESISKYTRDGSGWTVDVVLKVELVVARYQPLAATSYIRTPSRLLTTWAIVNIDNSGDEMCFLWSVLAHFHPQKKNKNRVSKYRQYVNTVNMIGIEYPVSVKSISKFEIQNPTISINVFGYDIESTSIDELKNVVYPLRITKNKDRPHHINLLLLTDTQGQKHYCLITDMSRLLSSLTKHNGKAFYCDYCLHRFSHESLLSEHIPNCTPYGPQKTRMPTENERFMFFKNFTYCLKVPFTIYADFESLIVPLQSCSPGNHYPTTVQSPSGYLYSDAKKITSPVSSTSYEAIHIPSGFCYAIVDHECKLIKPPVVYRGDNVVDTFLSQLTKESQRLMNIIRYNVPIDMTDADNNTFASASVCHLCELPLSEDDKVKNHCHLTGKFLGAAHNVCNLNYKMPQHIPVFFHNLRGYDCHHLIHGLGKYNDRDLSCIATTSERYVSFSLGSLRFVDSFQFLNRSLDTLVNNLFKSQSHFPVLSQHFHEHIDLLIRKGIYPYEYADSIDRFNETSLPAREHFNNKLTESSISDADYEHAQSVWKAFNMQTFGDYHDLYLLTDVLLLADVFESFRNMVLENYKLDPCHFYSLPGLAWNAMLKMTKVKLELLTDVNMHIYLEHGTRGGVAQVPNRYAIANNPLIPQQYDASRPNSFIFYVDCNNLYGGAMSKKLPSGDFRWLDRSEIDSLDIYAVSDDSDIGYILQVDLHYPKRLHDLHSDYPLAPERRCVTHNMLSPFSKRLYEKLNIQSTSSVEKLLTTLDDKQNYVLHIQNLKLYLSLGLELKAVHKVLCFKQSAWLKPFIDFNTHKRQEAVNSFEKDLYKLMNNAIYGKSLENVRKRIDFQLVSSERRLLKLASTPRLKRMIRYTDDLVGLSLRYKSIVLSRPIYVGFTVLDISKTIMYNFHYRYAVAKYGNNIKLLMTDTDSLLYSIQTNDVYSDIKEELHFFDTSDYPTSHPCYSTINKKVVGVFKDETCGRPIREFVGLRAKCYSYLVADTEQKQVAKGVPRVAIKRSLRHNMYRSCLMDHCQFCTSAFCISSEHHKLYTTRVYKLSLSPFDDKRFILNNGRDTLAYGHYILNQHSLTDSDLDNIPTAKLARFH